MRRSETGTGVAGFASRRPFEELLTALRKGADMLKHGRAGKPKLHFFRLVDSDRLLSWRSAKGTTRSVPLRSVSQVVLGQTTENFRRYPNPSFRQLSFSLLYTDKDDGAPRTLDLTAHDSQTFELWVHGLQALIDLLRAPPEQVRPSHEAAQLATQPANGAMGTPFGCQEAAPIKSPIISAPKSLSNAEGSMKVSSQWVGGGIAQGRVTGAVGLPVPEQQLGDCYMWGTMRPPQMPSLSPRPRQQSHRPESMRDTTHLDVMEVAAGLGHAGLLTRGGEMYMWGDGSGGRLGLGHQEAADSPERLHTLWGQPVHHIAVSDTCSAAITAEGRLWTWGEAFTTSLGYTGAQRQYIPRPVAGPLSEHVVVQVSCGPFHSAAVTSDGCLFTWGNGLYGKLGLGNQQSCVQPCKVSSLQDQLVTHVSCGAWHTAAIASPRPGGPNALEKLPFIERLTLQHKLATLYELTEEENGSLYTWGCVFRSDQTSLDQYPEPLTSRRVEQHRGCLGTGDRLGRLLPTRVGGSLTELAVTSIATGLAFTVAVTADGRVWQTGETGALGKEAAWEGAAQPCEVGGIVSKHFAHSVSAGRHHAAVLAGPRNGQGGRAVEGSESSIVLTWGKGNEGQLGTAAGPNDCALPRIVEELKGRRILQVACGAYQTVAVCLYDPKADDTEERRRGYKAKMKQWFAVPGRSSLDGVPAKETAAGPKTQQRKGHSDGRQVSLMKTLSGSGLLGPQLEARLQRKGGRRKGSTASEFGQLSSGEALSRGLLHVQRGYLETSYSTSMLHPDSRSYMRDAIRHPVASSRLFANNNGTMQPADAPGLNTPTQQVHTPTASGPAADGGTSDSNRIVPSRQDVESLRTVSEAGSKQSSLTSTDQNVLEAAIRHARTASLKHESEERDAYARSLEAKIDQLQETIRRQQSTGQKSLQAAHRQGSASARGASAARPAIVDLSPPSELARSISGVPSHPPAWGATTVHRGGQSSLPAGQAVRVSALPNARQSVLLQSIEDVHQAAVAANLLDPLREAAELERQRAFLAAQMALIEQRQQALVAAALPAAGLSPVQESVSSSRPDHANLGTRVTSGSRRSSSQAEPSTARRPDIPRGIRVRGHRRSRSGSGSGALKSGASTSPFLAPAQQAKAAALPSQPVPAEKGALKSREVATGVFLTIEPDGDGFNKLTRIRFARQHFSREAADVWWRDNKQELARRFALRASRPPSQPASGEGSPLSGPLQPTRSDVPRHSPSRVSSRLQRAETDNSLAGRMDTAAHSPVLRPFASNMREFMDSAKTDEWLREPGSNAIASLGLEEFRSARSRADALSSPEASVGFHTIREHAVSLPTSDAGSSGADSPQARARLYAFQAPATTAAPPAGQGWPSDDNILRDEGLDLVSSRHPAKSTATPKQQLSPQRISAFPPDRQNSWQPSRGVPPSEGVGGRRPHAKSAQDTAGPKRPKSTDSPVESYGSAKSFANGEAEGEDARSTQAI